MNSPWLCLDVSYLCHRAFHTTGGLSFKGRASGVAFGFLKSIAFLKDEFQTDRVAFCFDHPHLFRRDIYPNYKHRRKKEKSSEEKRAYSELAVQIQSLRNNLLPRIGFKNIFCEYGMEADDLLASLALHCPRHEELILVTADLDLLQCLSHNVAVYSPQSQKTWQVSTFRDKYDIHPGKWALLKAIAGCPGDDVPGIRSVGEKTALKFLRGELKEGKAMQAIHSIEGRRIVMFNRKLVELPFKGCPVLKLQDDKINEQGWREVCGELGMRSIAGRPPVVTRKLRQMELTV